MGAMNDRELLSYAALHCRTERALFAKEHVAQIYRLAGRPLSGEFRFLSDFVGVHEEVMMPLVEEARRRMFSPGPYSGTGR